MRWTLFPTVQAPSEARQKLLAFAGAVDERSLIDLKVVVSELVTISVAHGASLPIGLELEFVDEEVEGVLEDRGPGARAMARAKEMRGDSIVLRIIGSLVDEWGTDEGETRVWFRMPVNRLH